MNINSSRLHNLNLNVRGIQPSATLRINELSNRLKSEGKKIYKLGLGQSPFPVPAPVIKSLQENAFQKDYLPVKGLSDLRESIAHYFQRSQNIDCEMDDVIIGPGSKELLFILQLAYYGDLIIPKPSWVSYAPQAQIIGRSIHWLPTRAENNWQLTAEEIDLVCRDDPTRPRILILNYPNNPTGCTYSDSQLRAIAEVARKYKLILLSDEIYGELNYEGNHRSIAQYYPEGSIISSGLSKWCGAGGWRLGAFVFPKEQRPLLDAMAIIASETFTATSAPIQFAAVTAFNGGTEIDNYLNGSRQILAYLGSYFYRRLKQMKIDAVQPEGAFYIFPSFANYKAKLAQRDIFTSIALCKALLEDTGVAILPASDFGFPPDFLSVRMAFVDFNGEEALNAAKTQFASKEIDDTFVTDFCPNLFDALNTLETWLQDL